MHISLTKKILFSLALSVILIFLLEFGCRLFVQGGKWRAKGGPKINELMPYTFFGLWNPSSLYTKHSRHVFVSTAYEGKWDDIPVKKVNNEMRILVLGGSTASGVGASRIEKNFYKLLEKKLNERKEDKSKEIRVFSFGYGGWISSQEWVLLMKFCLKFDPNFVILFNGYNDASYHHPPDTPLYFNEVKTYLTRSEIQKIVGEIISGSAMIYLLRKQFYDHRTRSIDKDPKIKDKIIRNYSRNIGQMTGVLTTKNIGVLLALQPILTDKGYHSPSEREVLKKCLTCQYTADVYPGMVPVVQRVGERYSVPYKTQWFEDVRETVFPDMCHLNDLGHALVAEEMFEVIHPLIEKQSFKDQ